MATIDVSKTAGCAIGSDLAHRDVRQFQCGAELCSALHGCAGHEGFAERRCSGSRRTGILYADSDRRRISSRSCAGQDLTAMPDPGPNYKCALRVKTR